MAPLHRTPLNKERTASRPSAPRTSDLYDPGLAQQQPQETGGKGDRDMLMEAGRQPAGKFESVAVQAAHTAVRPG